MVRAILDGTKTVTRRIITSEWLRCLDPDDADDRATVAVRCRYGVPGDRLWVRERQQVIGIGPVTRRADSIRVRYLADGTESVVLPYPERLVGKPAIGKCLSYGGYRESSRIDLEVTGVRVEQLQDITEADILAEGVTVDRVAEWTKTPWSSLPTLHDAWRVLWDSINGERAPWKSNPLVWPIAFRRVRPALPSTARP